MSKENSKLDNKLKELERRYGRGTIISGDQVETDLESVSTGSIALDKATGVGGIPRGKLIEIMGPESSGKSTVTQEIIASFQRQGLKCAVIDSEQALDGEYAKKLGVKLEDLLIVQPECMEDGYNITEELIRTGEIALIVIDSHTALMPKKVVDGEVGDATIGLQARTNSIAIGKIKPLLKSNNCTLIAISQTRTNIGGYGDPNVSTGGNAYKFYCDMRMKVSRQNDKENQESKTTVEVYKNKCAIPFQKGSFQIVWGEGIDKMQEIIDFGVDFGFIIKGGAGWYTIGETKLQGDVKLKAFLHDNPEFYEELRERVLNELKK